LKIICRAGSASGAGLLGKVALPLLDTHLHGDTFTKVPTEPPIEVVDKIAPEDGKVVRESF